MTKSLAKNSKPHALIIGKPDSLATELLSKDLVLFLEVVDHSLLLFIEDAGNDNVEQLPRIELWSHD